MLPFRWARLFESLPPSRVGTALADRCFQVLDLLGFCDIYEALTNHCTRGIRRLTSREEDLLRTVFGESIPYGRIRIDERARIGPRRYGFYYVSFHTINAWGTMSDPVLIHEAVHIWQYVNFGALYIPRALAAQRTVAGYDYGGRAVLERKSDLQNFNFEQAAAIVEDAFRLRHGYPLRYANGCRQVDLALYDRYLQQIRRCALPEAYADGTQ